MILGLMFADLTDPGCVPPAAIIHAPRNRVYRIGHVHLELCQIISPSRSTQILELEDFNSATPPARMFRKRKMKACGLLPIVAATLAAAFPPMSSSTVVPTYKNPCGVRPAPPVWPHTDQHTDLHKQVYYCTKNNFQDSCQYTLFQDNVCAFFKVTG